MKYYLKYNEKIIYSGLSEETVDLHFKGKINEGFYPQSQVESFGLSIENRQSQKVVDREAQDPIVFLDRDGIEQTQERPEISHLEYFVEKNYEIVQESESYIELRVKAYPSLGEQMDMIFHDEVNGTTVWKDTIASIKALYPKPE